MSGVIIDLFAGPRGWSEGLRHLNRADVGIELDEAACLTARAAGHPTIRADVSRFPTAHLRGKVEGLIISAPCTPFSAAGQGAGKHIMALLQAALIATLDGRNVVGETRRQAARVLRAHALTARATHPRGKRSQWARQQAVTSCLVLEVARWTRDTQPDWIACEQVPGVLPLWRTLAVELRQRRHGYSTWAGVLNAADYGVPQTRQRAFLLASRTRPMHPPMPTHCRGGSDDLFGGRKPWVSMADALGWGMTERPSFTATAGGTSLGGVEVFARGGRDGMNRERERGSWLPRVPAAQGLRHD